MFISKKRNIVIPQSEHLRLAGTLAQFWGNRDFLIPDIHIESFILGVATHDRAFGFLDTAIVGQISEEERVLQIDSWLTTEHKNPEVELVVLHHVRRLMDSPDRKSLYEKIDTRIKEIAAENQIDLVSYEQADTITDVCDQIAFDFSFEKDTTGKAKVYAGNDNSVTIEYKIRNQEITISPWPFSVSEINSYILGYDGDGYPDRLNAVLLKFKVRPA